MFNCRTTSNSPQAKSPGGSGCGAAGGGGAGGAAGGGASTPQPRGQRGQQQQPAPGTAKGQEPHPSVSPKFVRKRRVKRYFRRESAPVLSGAPPTAC